jgi:hypothetical protein
VLDICCQATEGFSQPVNQWSDLRPARMRHQQTCNGKCGFFEFLDLPTQLLAVFVQLLQGFVVVDVVTVRGYSKLHVLVALVSQLLIIIFKYLAGLLLPVEEVLHVDF